MAHVMGWQQKLGISAASPVEVQYNFIGDGFTKTRPIILPQGGDGNLDPLNNRARFGVATIQGSVKMEPTVAELATLLPWIYGAASSGTSYPLGSTFAGYYMSIDKSSKVLDYAGVKVAKAVFEALPNQPMTLTLDLFALTETVSNSGTFPSLTPDYSTDYFVLTDGVFSVNSVTTCSEYFRLTIDNAMTYAPFTNCQTGPAAIISTERIITVEFLPGYGDHSALYPPAEAGWAVTATFTNGAVSCVFSMGKVKFQHTSPSAASMKEVVKLPLVGRAFRQSGTAALTTVLDSTP